MQAIPSLSHLARRVLNELRPSTPVAPDCLTLPHQVHFEFLRNVSAKSAQLFAEGFVRHNHQTDLSWLGIHPFADGVVVEIHEHGSGRALWPELASLYAAQLAERPKDAEISVVLDTSSMRQILVEISTAGVSTLVLMESERREVTRLGDGPTSSRLTPLHDDWALRATKLGFVAAACAALLVPLSFLARPGAHVVELAKAPAIATPPLAALQQAKPGPDEYVARLDFADGKWTSSIAQRPREILPTLKAGASTHEAR